MRLFTFFALLHMFSRTMIISQQTVSGGDKSRWVVGSCVLLALGHWCCLSASHHAPSPSLLRTQYGGSTSTLPTIPGAVAEAAAVSATTVKSQLTQSHCPPPDPTWPPSALPLGFPLGLRYRDMNSYDNRYGFFAMIIPNSRVEIWSNPKKIASRGFLTVSGAVCGGE